MTRQVIHTSRMLLLVLWVQRVSYIQTRRAGTRGGGVLYT